MFPEEVLLPAAHSPRTVKYRMGAGAERATSRGRRPTTGEADSGPHTHPKERTPGLPTVQRGDPTVFLSQNSSAPRALLSQTPTGVPAPAPLLAREACQRSQVHLSVLVPIPVTLGHLNTPPHRRLTHVSVLSAPTPRFHSQFLNGDPLPLCQMSPAAPLREDTPPHIHFPSWQPPGQSLTRYPQRPSTPNLIRVGNELPPFRAVPEAGWWGSWAASWSACWLQGLLSRLPDQYPREMGPLHS